MTPLQKAAAAALALALGVGVVATRSPLIKQRCTVYEGGTYHERSQRTALDGGVPNVIGECQEEPVGALEAVLGEGGETEETPRCACSPGPACLGLDGRPAMRGATLAPGTFKGACVPKVCVESGPSSWPVAECGREPGR
ncbi:MAG: hypothetical protein WC876_01915 [Candidatus Thermoplasmatota archaeon]|jgi:hypothetical protein